MFRFNDNTNEEYNKMTLEEKYELAKEMAADYLTTEITHSELADKYNVSIGIEKQLLTKYLKECSEMAYKEVKEKGKKRQKHYLLNLDDSKAIPFEKDGKDYLIYIRNVNYYVREVGEDEDAWEVNKNVESFLEILHSIINPKKKSLFSKFKK